MLAITRFSKLGTDGDSLIDFTYSNLDAPAHKHVDRNASKNTQNGYKHASKPKAQN